MPRRRRPTLRRRRPGWPCSRRIDVERQQAPCPIDVTGHQRDLPLVETLGRLDGRVDDRAELGGACRILCHHGSPARLGNHRDGAGERVSRRLCVAEPQRQVSDRHGQRGPLESKARGGTERGPSHRRTSEKSIAPPRGRAMPRGDRRRRRQPRMPSRRVRDRRRWRRSSPWSSGTGPMQASRSPRLERHTSASPSRPRWRSRRRRLRGRHELGRDEADARDHEEHRRDQSGPQPGP